MSKKIHPQTIIAGWRKATQAARDALREAAADHRSAPGAPLLRWFFLLFTNLNGFLSPALLSP